MQLRQLTNYLVPLLLFIGTPVTAATVPTGAELTGDDIEAVMVAGADGEQIDKGLALARETDAKDGGFGDIVATGKIVNKSEGGGQNSRVFEMVTVEMEDDGDRRFVNVTAPRSMRGTMFLSHSHALEADDVWVLLPGSSRLRRISAQDKTGRFLNSELTLEDISPWQVKKYSYRYLGKEPCGEYGERTCFLVENTPAYKHSGYGRQLEWLDAEIYQPRKIAYYDNNDQLMKVLTFTDYAQYAGKYWRPSYMEMSNKVTGAVSEIYWDGYDIDTGYEPSQVSPANITRLRR